MSNQQNDSEAPENLQDSYDKTQRLRDKLLPEIEAFKAERLTLQLATQDKAGIPNASYAPFALADDGFYILASEVARHGTNLKQSPLVSVMLLEDETEAKTVFARKRLTFDAVAELVERDSEAFSKGIAVLSARFGEMVDNLSQLTDFNLFKLNPKQGLYVKGFGQIFSLSGSELLDIDLKRDGHNGAPPKVELTHKPNAMPA